MNMRKEREALRLSMGLGLRAQQVADAIGIARNSVSRYVGIAKAAGMDWEAVAKLSDREFEVLLRPKRYRGAHFKPQPDWNEVHRQLQQKGATRMEVWCAFKAGQPDGIDYSTFNQHYAKWVRRLGLVMRQHHKPGKAAFVDFSGDKPSYVDLDTGTVHRPELFVGVLGYSNLTFAMAVMSQQQADWLRCHVKMFEYFGGVPQALVPDNLRAAVSKACRYDPQINPLYAELADHYGVAVLPTRARAPRDKAKAENAVLLAQRYILPRLKRHTYTSLAALNAAILELVDQINAKPFAKLPGNRRSRFEEVERHAMRGLPKEPFSIPELFGSYQVPLDYHVLVEAHAYSVPHILVRERVDMRLGAETIRFLHEGREVARHRRSWVVGGTTTCAEHMPQAHRAYAEQTEESQLAWACKIGASTEGVCRRLFELAKHPHAAVRATAGLQSLAKSYGTDRLEAACARALTINAFSYSSVKSILKSGLDRQPLAGRDDGRVPPASANVRGADYYRASAGGEQ